MNKQYASYQSTQLCRCHIYNWELCNYKWQVKLVWVPLLCDNFWLSKPLKNWLDLEVWRSTTKGQKLVYQVV
jgi:hypothetical protein